MGPANKGFTLLEMIVSLWVFSTVMLISTSAFLSLISVERRAAALVNIQDNLRFALEVMAKEIRTGTNYSSLSPFTSFSFTNAKGENVTYQLDTANNLIEKSTGGGAFLPLTSSQIAVNHLRFDVTTTGQPWVTITMKATAQLQTTILEFNLQTTVSQRKIAAP